VTLFLAASERRAVNLLRMLRAIVRRLSVSGDNLPERGLRRGIV
jgi:hypothetical protein